MSEKLPAASRCRIATYKIDQGHVLLRADEWHSMDHHNRLHELATRERKFAEEHSQPYLFLVEIDEGNTKPAL